MRRKLLTPLGATGLFVAVVAIMPMINQGAGLLRFPDPVRDALRWLTLSALVGTAANVFAAMVMESIDEILRAFRRSRTSADKPADQASLVARVLPWFLRLLPPRMRMDTEAFVREFVEVWDEDRRAGKSVVGSALKFGWWLVVLLSMALLKQAFSAVVGKWLGS
jgi:hypothetical protein